MGWLVKLISDIRSARAELNVPAGAKLKLLVVGANDTTQKRLETHRAAIERLARIEGVEAAPAAPKAALQLVVGEATYALPVGEVIDLKAEGARLQKEIKKLGDEVGKIDAKLGNAAFVAQGAGRGGRGAARAPRPGRADPRAPQHRARTPERMIALRAVESADGDALHAIFTEPGVRRFLFDDIELTRAETQEHVDAACAQGAWTIRQDGEIVGLVALRPVGADRELIVALSERCWGSGAAVQAARQALQHGFDSAGPRTDPRHGRSAQRALPSPHGTLGLSGDRRRRRAKVSLSDLRGFAPTQPVGW